MTCAKLICNECREDCEHHDYIGCADCAHLDCKYDNECNELEALMEHFEGAWGMNIDDCEADTDEESDLSYIQRTTWPVRISFLYTATGQTISLGTLKKDAGWQDLVAAMEESRYNLELDEVTKVVRLRLDVDEQREVLRLFVYCC